MMLDELIQALLRMRDQHGNVPVELYDVDHWETLPDISVEWSAAPACVLICGDTADDD